MTSSCTSILRIGGPLGSEESISIIQTELYKHFPTPKADDQRLLVRNKYFTASVQLDPFFDDASEKQRIQQGQSNSECGDDNGGIKDDCVLKEDGILLIFPSNNTHIETLTVTHDKLLQSNALVGDTLRLCIATFVGSTSTYTSKNHQEEEYSKRVLWCLDRGYEYVEVDMSEEGLNNGFDEREKDGFARVVEAIGGTVWSSAIMMKRTGMKAVADAAVGTSSELSKTTTIRSVSSVPVVAEKIGEDHNDDDDVKGHKKNTSVTDDKSTTLSSKEESMLENIEHIMEEAKRIRDSSRMGQLSDEDRRQRAGNAAEVLMGLLDQMGLHDDVDSSDSDCSDQ